MAFCVKTYMLFFFGYNVNLLWVIPFPLYKRVFHGISEKAMKVLSPAASILEIKTENRSGLCASTVQVITLLVLTFNLCFQGKVRD